MADLSGVVERRGGGGEGKSGSQLSWVIHVECPGQDFLNHFYVDPEIRARNGSRNSGDISQVIHLTEGVWGFERNGRGCLRCGRGDQGVDRRKKGT